MKQPAADTNDDVHEVSSTADFVDGESAASSGSVKDISDLCRLLVDKYNSTQWIKGAELPFDPASNKDVEVLKRDYCSTFLCKKCDGVFGSWPKFLDQMYREPVLPICYAEHPNAYYKPVGSIIVPHWENIVLFEQSAKQGCQLCVQFYAEISKHVVAFSIANRERVAIKYDEKDRLAIHLIWREKLCGPPEDFDTLSDEIRRFSRRVENLQLMSHLKVSEGPHIEATLCLEEANVNPPSSSPGATNDRACFELAKKWLQFCRSYHDCHPADITEYPTRLIAVNGTYLKLVLSSELPELAEYVTLSHCWGTSAILKLTKATFEEFQQEIPWSQLRKSFQEACYTTEELGFKYIWIDSLCIIQDCDEDWRYEAALMSKVYGGSSLNIAASDDHGMPFCGLFSERNPKTVQRLFVKLPKTKLLSDYQHRRYTTPGLIDEENLNFNSVCNQLSRSGHEQWFVVFPTGQYEKLVLHSRLSTRGWVFQERFLAPRTLFFSSQLAWMCRKKGFDDGSFLCETFPTGLPESYIRDSTKFYGYDGSAEHWIKVIQEFTECKLTFGSDRLLAISGVAQQLQERYKDRYVAGLWRKGMASQLLWHSCRSPVQGSKGLSHKKFTPPSWSWASYSGSVCCHHQYFGESCELLLQILDAKTVLCGPSDYGDVASGIVTLRSPYLLPITLAKSVSENVTATLGDMVGSKAKKNNSATLIAKVKFSWDEIKDVFGDLFLLGGVLNTRQAYNNKLTFAGLVLQATSSKQGEYRRVGFFTVDGFDNGQEEWDEMMAFLNEDARAEEGDFIGAPERDQSGRWTYCVTIL